MVRPSERQGPGGDSHVWQTKGLRERVFGSVARIRVRGGFFGSVANEEVRPEGLRCWRLAMERRVRRMGGGVVGVLRRTAGRGRIKCRLELLTMRRIAWIWRLVKYFAGNGRN